MKKLIYFPAVILALGLLSCKKDYVCTCTTTGSTTADVYTIVEVSKAAAKANCVSKSTTVAGSTYVETCDLAD